MTSKDFTSEIQAKTQEHISREWNVANKQGHLDISKQRDIKAKQHDISDVDGDFSEFIHEMFEELIREAVWEVGEEQLVSV